MKDWHQIWSNDRDTVPDNWVCNVHWGGNDYADRPISMPGLQGHVLSIPAGDSEQGGDIHHITVCGHGVFSKFLLIDVSGHGETAAKLSTALGEPLQRLMEQPANDKMLGELNAIMMGMEASGRFATAVAATYNNMSHEWIYAYAGHPYMLTRINGVWQELPSSGDRTVPAGVIDETEYYQTSISLVPGQTLLMFTDALIEMRHGTGRLESGGLIDLLNRIKTDDPNQLYPQLVEKLIAVNGSNDFEDDLSFILLQHQPELKAA